MARKKKDAEAEVSLLASDETVTVAVDGTDDVVAVQVSASAGADENLLPQPETQFYLADNVDAKGQAWPTVGENIRNGANSVSVIDRMPDLEAVGEFWSKMTGIECEALVAQGLIVGGAVGKVSAPFAIGTDGIYIEGKIPVAAFALAFPSSEVSNFLTISTTINGIGVIHMFGSGGSGSFTVLVILPK